MIMPSYEQRQKLITYLKSNDILSVFHYLPLHLSDMGAKFGAKKGDCPVTEDISDRLVRLPFYNDLTEDDQQKVINTLSSF
jgi:dTDP-4-amino-4,6-dideoxygalactose transaminase